MYKYLQLGDLITSRNNDPLVSSTLSVRIPLASLSTIKQLINTAEYRQFKLDPTKLNLPIELQSDSLKADLFNEFTQLTNQQLEHHQLKGENRFKHFRVRRHNLDQLSLNKQIDKRTRKLFKQTVSQTNNGAYDQLLLLKKSFTNKLKAYNKLNERKRNAKKSNGEIRLKRTINQANDLINLIQKNFNDSNLMPLRNLFNNSLSASKSLAKNNRQTIQATLSDLNEVTNKGKNLIKDQHWPPKIKSFYSIFKNTKKLKMIKKDEEDKEDSVHRTNLSFSPISSSIDPLDYSLHKLSISNRLPSAEALIFDNEDKLNDEFEQDKGLELSCIATITQPIATTYDDVILEENSYLERKTIQDQQSDQPIYVQDELFSAPRILSNDEHLISTGQRFNLNCTVSLIQHWSFNRLHPILKWFINDREVCYFSLLFIRIHSNRQKSLSLSLSYSIKVIASLFFKIAINFKI